MGDPYLDILSVLFGPQLWWLWESIIVINYFLLRFMANLNKVLIFRMSKVAGKDEDKGVWFGQMQLVPRKKSFRSTKRESHTQEPDKVGLIVSGGWTSRPVYFFNKKRTRPLYAHFEEVEHDPQGNSYNPTADDWDTFATEEAYRQGKQANRTAKADLSMVIMAAIAAGAIALLIGYFIHPAQCPPDFSCIPVINGTIPANGAITRTITSAHP